MDTVHEQLTKSRTIAVVGISLNPERPSHYVSKYMQEQGYRIIPVNPLIEEVLGEKAYPGPEVGAGADRHGGRVPALGDCRPRSGRRDRGGREVRLDAGWGGQRGGGREGEGGGDKRGDGQLNAARTSPPVRRRNGRGGGRANDGVRAQRRFAKSEGGRGVVDYWHGPSR